MLDNKLRSLLMEVSTNTIWGLAIHEALNTHSDLSALVLELQDQYADNPCMMASILGAEAVKLIANPFKKILSNLSHDQYPHKAAEGFPR